VSIGKLFAAESNQCSEKTGSQLLGTAEQSPPSNQKASDDCGTAGRRGRQSPIELAVYSELRAALISTLSWLIVPSTAVLFGHVVTVMVFCFLARVVIGPFWSPSLHLESRRGLLCQSKAKQSKAIDHVRGEYPKVELVRNMIECADGVQCVMQCGVLLLAVRGLLFHQGACLRHSAFTASFAHGQSLNNTPSTAGHKPQTTHSSLPQCDLSLPPTCVLTTPATSCP
jgi:hypothetical protein